MSRWLHAAHSASPTKDRTDTTDETLTGGMREAVPEAVLSVVSVVSAVRTLERSPSALAPSPDAQPYRHSVTGSPCTWTGCIVSLDEWRKLTEWERHGSTGKMWNGLTGQWEDGGGA